VALDTFVKVGLIIVIILLVAVLGVLTGFIVLPSPETTSTISTTTTTEVTTTPPTSSTTTVPITILTTVTSTTSTAIVTTTTSTTTITSTTIQETTTIFTTITTVELGLTVTRVIDGDTIELSNGETVRLIGINAPESSGSCYTEAKNELEELIENKEVTLEKDVSDRDMYGRLLRYVYVDSLFVNLEMVRSGYATAYEYPPDIKYSVEIANVETEAKTNQYGCIWQPSTIPDCFSVVTFHYDAEDNDNYNLNDEYFTLKNTCDFLIDMTSWTAKDEATHIYTFPQFDLASQSTVTIYSGTGTDTSTELYWGRTYGSIWNNGGDTLYLRDSDGKLVLTHSY